MENDNYCVISTELVVRNFLVKLTQAAAQASANTCE